MADIRTLTEILKNAPIDEKRVIERFMSHSEYKPDKIFNLFLYRNLFARYHINNVIEDVCKINEDVSQSGFIRHSAGKYRLKKEETERIIVLRDREEDKKKSLELKFDNMITIANTPVFLDVMVGHYKKGSSKKNHDPHNHLKPKVYIPKFETMMNFVAGRMKRYMKYAVVVAKDNYMSRKSKALRKYDRVGILPFPMEKQEFIDYTKYLLDKNNLSYRMD